MEKTSTNKTSETFEETSRTTNKWLADTCNLMSDFYEKQLKNTWDAYSVFFNSFSGSEKNGHAHTSPFFSGTNFYRSAFNPFSFLKSDNGFGGSFTNHMQEVSKQMTEFASRISHLWAEQFKSSNWDEFNKMMEEEWKITQNRINFLHTAYMKRLNNSLEFNKKLAHEMNSGFEAALAANKKMWDDMMKKKEATDRSEKETDRRDWQPKKHVKELAHHH